MNGISAGGGGLGDENTILRGLTPERETKTGILANKSILIVHVGSAMGRACALRFAAEGGNVVVVDPVAAAAQEVVDEIQARGGLASLIVSESDNEVAIQEVLTKYSETRDDLDVLMVAGGLFDFWSPSDETMSNWETIVRANLLVPTFYAKAFRKLLARSDGGSVIFYGSIDGLYGNPRLQAYSAARGGLIPVTHMLAHQFGGDGTRVNLIAGASISPLGTEARLPVVATVNRKRALQSTSLGRFAEPHEFSGVALFLASQDSSYVTGSVVTADGGRATITPGTGL